MQVQPQPGSDDMLDDLRLLLDAVYALYTLTSDRRSGQDSRGDDFARRNMSPAQHAAGSAETNARINGPKVGDLIPDRTIFAGISPDTGNPMFTTPLDAPLTYT